MKVLGKSSVGLIVLLSLCSGGSQAAVGEGSNQISARVGAAFPTSANDFNESAKAGVAGGVQYLRHISSRLGVGVQADYFSFPGKDREIVLPAGRLDAESDSTAFTAELVGRYSFRIEKKVSPYIMAGLGAAHFSQETNATPQNGTTWADTATREERMVADDSSTGYALSLGLGLETALSANWLAAIETNWHIFGVDSDKFGSDAINVPSLFLRLGTRF